MANLTFAIADLHGSYDLLERALEAIGGYEPGTGESRTVVFLGDYIDRGPQSREIIERLMAGPPPGWRWVALKGNHEDMLLQTVDRLADPAWWLGNGGVQTVLSYNPDAAAAAIEDIPPSHIAWIRALPLLAVDTHRVFVHAGVDPAKPLDRQSEEEMLWSREDRAVGHGSRHVVHGHTPDPDGPVQRAGRSNFDTLAWKTGRLAVGVFDDERPGRAIDLIEVRRSGETLPAR